MRFVLRSAFWIAIAFAVIQPTGMNLGAAASSLSEKAISEGSRVAAEQLGNTECTSLECHGSKAVISAIIEDHVAAPNVELVQDAPFPMPRLQTRG